MKYKDMIEWLRAEFPQVAWSSSTLFGSECIVSNIRSSKIYVKIIKSRRYGVDFDNRTSGFSTNCDDLEAVKRAIIECMNEIDPKILKDTQPALL